MAITVHDEAKTYRLIRPDGLGFFKKRSARQFAIGIAGVFLGVVALVATKLGAGPRAFLGVVGLGVIVVAMARTLSGEDVVELVAPAFGYGYRRLRSRRWAAPLCPTGGPANTSAVPEFLGGTALFDFDPRAMLGRAMRPVGVIRDHADGTVALALRVHGQGFLVAESSEQDYRVSAWGQALAGFCRDGQPVVRVAWSQWLAPAGIEEHRAWLEQTMRADPDPEMVAAYDEVLSEAGRAATVSEVLVTISVAIGRVKVLAHHGDDRLLAATERLLDEAERFTNQLQRAGLVVSLPLSASAMARTLRDRLDPGASARLDARGRSVGDVAGLVSPSNGFPMAAEECSRRTIRVDDCFHRVFRVMEWPRTSVRADWMAGFLCAPDAVRSFTVIFVPQNRRIAKSQATQLATTAAAEVEDRVDHRKYVNAEQRRVQMAATALEEELEAGAGMELFLGLVDVAALSEDELEGACERTIQAASNCGMELRPIDFRQPAALAAVLPIGRGVTATLR